MQPWDLKTRVNRHLLSLRVRSIFDRIVVYHQARSRSNEPQKRKKLSGAQFRQQKREKDAQKKKLEGSLEKFLNKPENRETECQENVGVASTSAALNLEVMEVSEERYISPLEEVFSKTKTRESTAEEPKYIVLTGVVGTGNRYTVASKQRARECAIVTMYFASSQTVQRPAPAPL
ncbi:hypothetical protein EVAR_9747_1 [Eumeta japonica]|uniref:Uncharacterized protein n=1 Tax=Eumeta variegata TaxID=151549 RepID=A0A4C1U5D0_EUMVA|nr:hypothetical protein EVAR_9747_1 [Eumeta japonica]